MAQKLKKLKVKKGKRIERSENGRSARVVADVSMQFCDKCGSIMIPQKTSMKCRRCGASKRGTVKLKISEDVHKIKGITVLEKDETPLPQTLMQCPECNHNHAYWWMQQTRSADEPPTQFFRCVKCQHVWREYK